MKVFARVLSAASKSQLIVLVNLKKKPTVLKLGTIPFNTYFYGANNTFIEFDIFDKCGLTKWVIKEIDKARGKHDIQW